jgi:hypothetical protein
MTDLAYGAPELVQAFATERVPPGAVALWWLGQASFTFKSSRGAIVYVDPYLADYHPEQACHVMGRFGKYLHLKGSQ